MSDTPSESGPAPTGDPGERADDRPAASYAGRGLVLKASPGSLAVTDDLTLEWKGEDKDAETPTAFGVENVSGVDCIGIETGNPVGWVRLCCEQSRRDKECLLGLRLLIRLSSADKGSGEIHFMLSETDTKSGRREGIGSTYATVKFKQDAWYEVQGVFACAAPKPGKRFDIILNLQKKCRITLAAMECRWIDAALSETRQQELKAKKAEPICDISAKKVEDADLPDVAKAGVFAARAKLSGLTVRGWALPAAAGAKVVSTHHGDSLDVPLKDEVEIASGVTVTSGFSFPLSKFAPHGVTAVGFALGESVNRPFAVVDAPRILGRFAAASEGDSAQSDAIDLFFYPDCTATNPYQSLMYGGLDKTNSRPGDIDAAIDRIRDTPTGHKVVLHLHWLGPVLAGATAPSQAEARRMAFRDKLSHFVSLGGIVIWTVHDTPPQDDGFPDAERKLRQDVADHATTIHVHSERLLPALTGEFELADDKLLIAPHPNFIGHYPNYVDRAGARERLSLDPNAKVLLFLGRLHPCKGLDRLVSCFLELRKSDPDLYLLIVGKPAFPYEGGYLARKYHGQPNLRVVEGHIADTTLQWYYNACDWVVLPYENVLTSGAMMAAMSFSRPCVAPRLGMIPDILKDGETGFSYDPADENGLLEALRQAIALPPERRRDMETAALGAVAPLTWDDMANALQAAFRKTHQFRHVSLPFDDGVRDCLLMGPAFPPERAARTAIIILNYDHLDDVERLIASLERSTVRDFDIYVVDNCSPSLSEFDLLTHLRHVRVLRLPENMGYAAGNNAAMRLIEDLDYEFLWILNPDMVVPPNALEQHLEAAETHPETSVFGPVICPGENSTHVASGGCTISFENGFSSRHMYPGEHLSVLPKAPYRVDFVTGASVFLRRSVLDRIGHIPEDYFLYFEETHWLLEAGRKGVHCMVLPDIRLAHHKRSEEGGLPERYYLYYYLRNSLVLSQRFGTHGTAATINRLRSGFIRSWLQKIGRQAPQRMQAYERLIDRALADGAAGKTGPADLVAIELSIAGKTGAALPPIESFQASCEKSGTLFGVFTLAEPLSRAPAVSVACGDEIVVETPAERAVNGNYVFSAELPPEHRDGRQRSYRFYLDGHPAPDHQVRVMLPRPAPDHAGRIDGLQQFCCHGWACNQSDPGEAVTVELLHQGEVVARGVADRFRPDLAGSHRRNGHAAFSLRLPRRFADGEPHELSLRIAGEDRVLHTGEFKDSEIAGGMGPEPPEAVLRRAFHQRQLSIASHEFDALPIGRHMHLAERNLVREHAGAGEATRISIIMTLTDRGGSVRRAIDSVRGQTCSNWELLVVDDGSGRDAAARQVKEETGDDRIRLVASNGLPGTAAARNAGLAQAGGDIIAYLDDKTVWMPDFLTIMAGEMSRQPADVGAAYCGQRIMHVCGTADAPVEELVAVRMGAFHLALLENRDVIDLSCYVHRREFFDRLGGFNTAMDSLDGWEFIMRQSLWSTPHYVPALLCSRYRGPADCGIDGDGPPAHELEHIAQAGVRALTAKPQDDMHLRPVDIVLIATAARDSKAMASRIADIAASVPDGADCRLFAYVAPQIRPELENIVGHDAVTLCEADTDTAALALALGQRRTDADLAVLCENALPARGWLQGFNRAVARAGQAGMLISRQSVNGKAAGALDHSPFANRKGNVCVAVSAKSENLIDAEYEPRENLLSVSGFVPFCTYIVNDCADTLEVSEAAEFGLQGAFDEFGDFIRAHLRRDVVYAGRVQVFDMALTPRARR